MVPSLPDVGQRCRLDAGSGPDLLATWEQHQYCVDITDQMARAHSVKGSTEDGQWRSSITSSTWLGSMPTSYSRSTSSRRAQRKVLQQLSEELRAEYMEGKAAVGTRWAAVEATTAAAADTDTEAMSVRKSSKWNRMSDTGNATSPCVVTVRRAEVI